MNKQFLFTMLTTLLHYLYYLSLSAIHKHESFWLCFYVIHFLLLSPFSQQCSKISWHCVVVQSPRSVQLFMTPWTAARQASVPHHLLKFFQVHVHCIGDAIQPSHPLMSSSPSSFNLSQNHRLFQWVKCSHQITKILEFQLQHQSFQRVFRVNFLPGLTLLSKDLSEVFLQHHSSKASILQHSAFFKVQLSQQYMTTGKTIVLTMWAFVRRIMCLLFSTLSRFVIASDFMAAFTFHSDFRAQEEEICHYLHLPPPICHDVMWLDATILVFFMFIFNTALSLSSFALIKRFFRVPLHAEYIMKNAGLNEGQAGIKIARRNINNLRYTDEPPLWQKVKN